MSFWNPQPLGEKRYRLPATPAGCVGVPGRYAMMGGVTSAAVIAAMEDVTGKQLLWSSTQFVSHAPSEVDFDIEITLLAEGARITQAQGSLFHGERLVLRSAAALGEIAPKQGGGFCEPKTWHSPESCPEKFAESAVTPGGLLDQFDRRTAQQNDESGFEALWFRSKDRVPTSSGLLAVLGDFLPGATSMTRGASSVDNTLRINRVEQCEWLLAETSLQSLQGRLYQGTMNVFSETGVLLAVASQTGICPK